MTAELVFNNTTCLLRVPDCMGLPRKDQLQGTPAEQLVELCGRICYDSLGKGRSSKEFHEHIRESGHLSVLEHFNFTVRFEGGLPLPELLNRPGVWADLDRSCVTANLRAVVEWDKWDAGASCSGGGDYFTPVGDTLRYFAAQLAPQIVSPPIGFEAARAALVPAQTDEERWVSLLLSGSRGFSHEAIRHRFRTAVSQRSTRYCDESESAWVLHPELKYQTAEILRATAAGQHAYRRIVEDLTAAGKDRKTARGAARGYLGNALYTEMIFSASVAQWKRIFAQRISVHADAEIREIMTAAKEVVDGNS